MKVYGFLLILLLGLSQAQAKTILISDIDDTIKNSHVLDKPDALFNADKIENTVLGVNALYELASRMDPTLKFFYITNAPKTFMEGSHRDFLKYNKFPRGALRLRESLFQNDFKVTEIRKVLKAEKPEFAILLGDNGEKDIYVYQQIEKEFPDILFITYIRQAYTKMDSDNTGNALKPGQKGFVTALDLLLQFRHEGFVDKAESIGFVRDFITVYSTENDRNSDGAQAIPAWLDCRDFKWTAEDSDLMMLPGYVATKNRIQKRCSIPALED
jgi:uncharacterized protein DUF2183